MDKIKKVNSVLLNMGVLGFVINITINTLMGKYLMVRECVMIVNKKMLKEDQVLKRDLVLSMVNTDENLG